VTSNTVNFIDGRGDRGASNGPWRGYSGQKAQEQEPLGQITFVSRDPAVVRTLSTHKTPVQKLATLRKSLPWSPTPVILIELAVSTGTTGATVQQALNNARENRRPSASVNPICPEEQHRATSRHSMRNGAYWRPASAEAARPVSCRFVCRHVTRSDGRSSGPRKACPVSRVAKTGRDAAQRPPPDFCLLNSDSYPRFAHPCFLPPLHPRLIFISRF